MSNDSHIYSILPTKTAMDERLEHRHLRTLISLFSFRDKNANLTKTGAWPLAIRANLPTADVAKAIAELEAWDLIPRGLVVDIGFWLQPESERLKVLWPTRKQRVKK